MLAKGKARMNTAPPRMRNSSLDSSSVHSPRGARIIVWRKRGSPDGAGSYRWLGGDVWCRRRLRPPIRGLRLRRVRASEITFTNGPDSMRLSTTIDVTCSILRLFRNCKGYFCAGPKAYISDPCSKSGIGMISSSKLKMISDTSDRGRDAASCQAWSEQLNRLSLCQPPREIEGDPSER